MKKIFTIFGMTVWVFLSANAQTTFEIKSQGFSFSPANVTVNTGDLVKFNTGSDHPVLQVSQATWSANGSSALGGGFDFPQGSGEIVFQQPGTYYYICPSHISSGMKGTIVVSQVTALNEKHSDREIFSVFPNPMHGNSIFISFFSDKKEVVSFRMLSIDGKIVTKTQNTHCVMGKNEIRVEIESVSPGIYIAELRGEGFSQKVSVVRQ